MDAAHRRPRSAGTRRGLPRIIGFIIRLRYQTLPTRATRMACVYSSTYIPAIFTTRCPDGTERQASPRNGNTFAMSGLSEGMVDLCNLPKRLQVTNGESQTASSVFTAAPPVRIIPWRWSTFIPTSTARRRRWAGAAIWRWILTWRRTEASPKSSRMLTGLPLARRTRDQLLRSAIWRHRPQTLQGMMMMVTIGGASVGSCTSARRRESRGARGATGDDLTL